MCRPCAQANANWQEAHNHPFRLFELLTQGQTPRLALATPTLDLSELGPLCTQLQVLVETFEEGDSISRYIQSGPGPINNRLSVIGSGTMLQVSLQHMQASYSGGAPHTAVLNLSEAP